MSAKPKEAQNPLILRCNRLMEAFAKSDDERDFYLDRREGFIVYVDLDKPTEELEVIDRELEKNSERYCMIPKLTFYETKKIMEGFINEKVYDIDTKEKLLDIIQSKEAREHFLDFIYDHHSELEKWHSYYQERSRIRIIEWLRTNNFHFVFEEDLEIPKLLMEKLKKELFEPKVGKDVATARKSLFSKAKTYYSSEALNPRPKRGRPPKQIQKTELEPQVTIDIYTTVPNGLRAFLFTPDTSSTSSSTFSSKFGTEDSLFSTKKHAHSESDLSIESLNQKLEALRHLSAKWRESEETKQGGKKAVVDEIEDFDDEEDDEEIPYTQKRTAINGKRLSLTKKAAPAPKKKAEPAAPKKKPTTKPKAAPAKKTPSKAKPATKKKR